MLGDIFSLGITLLYLATGATISPFAHEDIASNSPWRRVLDDLKWSNRTIKRKVYQLLGASCRWKIEYEDKLAVTEIVFACLRITDNRFYNARSIKEVLERFRATLRHPRPSLPADHARQNMGFKQALGSLAESIDNSEGVGGTLIALLYKDRLRRITLP